MMCGTKVLKKESVLKLRCDKVWQYMVTNQIIPYYSVLKFFKKSRMRWNGMYLICLDPKCSICLILIII